MSDTIHRLKSIFVSKKFLEFCALGIVNTFDTACFSSLFHYLHLQANLAAVLGYFFSLTVAFYFNCYLVFHQSPSFRGYFRFLLSYIPHFTIYFAVSFLTINVLHLGQFWATVLAVAVGGPLTFFLIKIFAFGQKDS